jgi:hypothetical protein
MLPSVFLVRRSACHDKALESFGTKKNPRSGSQRRKLGRVRFLSSFDRELCERSTAGTKTLMRVKIRKGYMTHAQKSQVRPDSRGHTSARSGIRRIPLQVAVFRSLSRK